MTGLPSLYDQVHRLPGYCPDGVDRAREALPRILAALPDSVLDVGCGRGGLVRYLRRAGVPAIGIDPFLPELTDYCMRGQLRECLSADMFGLVDAITCCDVLEHLEQDQAIELVRDMDGACSRFCFAIANMPDVHDVPGYGPTDLHLLQHDPTWWLTLIRAVSRKPLELQTLHYPERFFIWGGLWP